MIILNEKAAELKNTEAKTIIEFFPNRNISGAAERFIEKHPFLVKEDIVSNLYDSEVIFTSNTLKNIIIIPVCFSFGNDEKNEPEIERVIELLQNTVKTLKSPIAVNLTALNLPTRKPIFWRNFFAEHEKMFQIYE